MNNPGLYFQHLETCILVATADCESVLELGCGTCDKLAVCQCWCREGVDAHEPYLALASRRWKERVHMLHEEGASDFAEEAAFRGREWDAVLMIDFIEHLEKGAGEKLLETCKSLAHRRIILYCPEGWFPQDQDIYDLGGEYWQTHRSSWTYEDLEQRGFKVARWIDRHGPDKHALFAVWNHL